MAWVPLVLASAGLVVMFAAGMWNIGVEGQIILGAIAATWVARVVPGSGALLVPLCMVAGIAGGMAWALLAGVLRTRGRVNEIFGGLGLDFVATGLVIYLILGPWKRAGIASTSGTDLFRTEAWLPTLRELERVGDRHPRRPRRRRARGRADARVPVRPPAEGGGEQRPQRVPDGHPHQPVPARGVRVLRGPGRAGRELPGDGRPPQAGPGGVGRVGVPGDPGRCPARVPGRRGSRRSPCSSRRSRWAAPMSTSPQPGIGRPEAIPAPPAWASCSPCRWLPPCSPPCFSSRP